jgi:fucose permease
MRTPRNTLILLCALFTVQGMLTAGIGPILPDLARNTLSSLESVGVTFTALFLGALISQIISGPLTDRIGPRPVLLTGMGLMAGGFLGISFSTTYPLLITFGFLAGLGSGVVDICVNILAAVVFRERSVSALNLVNFFFGAGAIIGPAITSYTLLTLKTGIPVLWVGCAILLIIFPLTAIFLLSPKETRRAETPSGTLSPYLSPLLWLLGLVLFLCLGMEYGIGGWTSSYMQLTAGSSGETGALVVSGFWLAVTIGRLIVTAIGSKWSPTTLMTASLVGTLLGGVMMAVSTGNLVVTILSVLVTGFFIGPVYPTAFALATNIPGLASGKAVSIVIALASLGGMILPPLQGVFLTRTGPVSSVIMVAVMSFIMLGLFVQRTRLDKRSNPV